MDIDREQELLGRIKQLEDKLFDTLEYVDKLEETIFKLNDKLEDHELSKVSHGKNLEKMHKIVKAKDKTIDKHKSALTDEKDKHSTTADALKISLQARKNLLVDMEMKND